MPPCVHAFCCAVVIIGERQRALRAVRRRRRGRAVGATRAAVDVGGDPAAQRTKLPRGGRVAGDGRLVRQQDELLVALDLVAPLARLIDVLAVATRLVDGFLRARNDHFLAADLRAVADADGRGGRGERHVVAFKLRVAGGSGERVGLPFVEDGVRRGGAGHRL